MIIKRIFYFSAYDPTDNQDHLAGLASGSDSFRVIALNKHLKDGFQQSVQWDGSHMTISNSEDPAHDPVSVYRLRISGDTAAVIGTTQLHNRKNHHAGQSWIQGNTIIGIDYTGYRDVAFWAFPNGGKPEQRITRVGGLRTENLYGVTVSVPP